MSIDEIKDKLSENFGLTGINTESYMIKSDGMLWLFCINNYRDDWCKSYDFNINDNTIEITEYIDSNTWDWNNAQRKTITSIDGLISDIRSSLIPNHALTDKKNSFILKN
jgi:hypothetical protein